MYRAVLCTHRAVLACMRRAVSHMRKLACVARPCAPQTLSAPEDFAPIPVDPQQALTFTASKVKDAASSFEQRTADGTDQLHPRMWAELGDEGRVLAGAMVPAAASVVTWVRVKRQKKWSTTVFI